MGDILICVYCTHLRTCIKCPGIPGTVMILPWGSCCWVVGVPAETGVGFAIAFPPPSECGGTPILVHVCASNESGEGLGAVLLRPAAPVCTTFISAGTLSHCACSWAQWANQARDDVIEKTSPDPILVFFSPTYLQITGSRILITFIS